MKKIFRLHTSWLKLSLAVCPLFISFSNFSFAQSNEGHLSEITSRVTLFLPIQDQANLEGNERYIQLGIAGADNDVKELVGYIERFAINDRSMTIKNGESIFQEMNEYYKINYYKFYLDPLYDANNFQQMLEMFRIKKFFIGSVEHPVKDFSNLIYASIKSKKQ